MTIGIGVFLIAVGAILKFATNFDVQDVNMDTVGVILMIAGGAGILLGFIQDAAWSRNRRAGVPPADPYADPRYQQPPAAPQEPPPPPPPDQRY